MLQAEKSWRIKDGRAENLGQAWWYNTHTERNQGRKGKEKGGGPKPRARETLNTLKI